MKEYFKLEEFACPDCGKNLISPALVDRLNEAREIAEVPFIINSGYRCEKHNKEVGGSPTSSHLKGLAVDIRTTNSSDRFKILSSLLASNFRRLGVGKDFIHADLDSAKAQEVIWDYYKGG